MKWLTRSRYKSEEGSVGLPDLGDSIDVSTFEQICERLSDHPEGQTF
jgi:hypothetical protein